MALLNTIETLPSTSAEAFRRFDERYLAGVSAVEPDTWVEELGDVFDVDSPDVTFPIGLLSTKYEETKGESRAKTMEEKEVRLKAAEYDAGYEAKLLDLLTKVFAYRKWEQAPARFIKAEKRLLLSKIAALLEAGTSGLSPWDGVAFFHASAHEANPAEPGLATFGNYQSSGKDPAVLANIEEEVATMMTVPDEDGQVMGVYPTHIGLPTAKFEKVKNTLGKEIVVIGSLDGSGGGTMGTEDNPYKGVIQPVHMPQLTDANDWYLFDANIMKAQGVPPWAALRYFAGAALGMRTWDESSDFFKNSSKIKVSSHIWYGFSLMFPHAVRRVTGA